MIESGVIIVLGLIFIAIKLPKGVLVKALGYPVAIDLIGTLLTYVMHMGTFSGVMAAAVAGVLISLATSAGRWACGYVEKGMYYPGRIWDFRHELKKG